MNKCVLFFLISFVCNVRVSAIDGLKYYQGTEFLIIGKGFEQTESFYDRLPTKLKGIVREPVWVLSKNCSGFAIRFRTNSTSIAARWELTSNVSMDHMASVGIKGLDLYCYQNNKWQYVNSGRPVDKKTTATIISNLDQTEKEYMLYLPLYDGVVSLEIGVDSLASITLPKIDSPKKGRPIVFYGTSITQGGCASRTGMSYPNQLSRLLDREIINLGFSGNGRLDYEIAQAMTEIDASIFVLDCIANCSNEELTDRTARFIEIIRAVHPATPIIMMDNIQFPHMYFDNYIGRLIPQKNSTFQSIHKQLKDYGDKNIYYIKNNKMIGDDSEATVDGVHLTDLGFKRMTESIYPIFKKVLKKTLKK